MDLQRYVGPYGIPIYHQQMPDIVKSACLAWVTMVGSADDTRVGQPGLYHWFEHVPFRGTAQYPGGNMDIMQPIQILGGDVGAWTSTSATVFDINLPVHAWRRGLSVITDLVSQPLLREDDITAERDIIRSEIIQAKSKSTRAHYNLIKDMLWHGHPYGHPVLGDEDTLDLMNAEIMEEAHQKGYDRSRMSLFVVGNIPIQEVVAEIERLAPFLPERGLSERRSPASYGMPAWKGGTEEHRAVDFPSSMVSLLFPLSSHSSQEDLYFYESVIQQLFGWGGLTSPLLRTAREERHLVYHAWVRSFVFPDGGAIGFSAETKPENVQAVIDAFKDVFEDPEVTSPQRIKDIAQGIRSALDMQIVDPEGYVSEAIQDIIGCGRIVKGTEICDRFDAVSSDMAQEMVSKLRLGDARVIVSEGSPELTLSDTGQ